MRFLSPCSPASPAAGLGDVALLLGDLPRRVDSGDEGTFRLLRPLPELDRSSEARPLMLVVELAAGLLHHGGNGRRCLVGQAAPPAPSTPS